MDRVREHMLEQFENALSGDHAQNVVQFSADNTQQRTSSALEVGTCVRRSGEREGVLTGRVA
jgi:hypothetical protein